jgi:ribosome-associated protein
LPTTLRRGLIGVLPGGRVLSQSTTATAQAAAPQALKAKRHADYTSEAVLECVLSSLDDDKAEEVVSIDLRGKTSMADHMVVCSGRSSRQVASIADKLTERLKEQFGMLCKTEGQAQGDWVLIDAHDVIIHVFRPEVREFYQLEKMWLSPVMTPTNGQTIRL